MLDLRLSVWVKVKDLSCGENKHAYEEEGDHNLNRDTSGKAKEGVAASVHIHFGKIFQLL